MEGPPSYKSDTMMRVRFRARRSFILWLRWLAIYVLNLRPSELLANADSPGKVFLSPVVFELVKTSRTRESWLSFGSLVVLAKRHEIPRLARVGIGAGPFVDRERGGVAYWLQPRTPVGRCHGMGAKRRGYPETPCRALV